MKALQRSMWLVAAAATCFLAACGGGGGDAPAGSGGTQTPPPPPSNVALVAVAGSANDAALAWTPPSGPAIYTLERKSGGGDWVAIASVDARSGSYLDSGLAALTDYSYRLVAAGAARTSLAESATRTSDEQPVITAAGSALEPARTATVGAAGGTLASSDGAIVIGVPAGALAADTAASIQRVTNTAPDGHGDGLQVRLDAAPAAALTLTVRYGADEDTTASGQRIAVQRTDGSWISLPLSAHDKTAHTLTAELPAHLLVGVKAPAAARAAQAAPSAAGISIVFTIVRYEGYGMRPRQGRVAVKHTLDLAPYARVRGFEIWIESCHRDPGGEPICVPMPMMETREIPLLNARAGFERHWYVFADEGGNATCGTVAAAGSSGATFTAPASVPDPSTVTVTFQSRNTTNGRTLTLSSPVEIAPDRWVGTMTAATPVSSEGSVLSAVAHATWDRDEAASSGTRTVYRATGDLANAVTDDDCTVSITPASQPVSADPQLVELAVDEGTRPATYRARLVTFWPATVFAQCPKASGSKTVLVGYGWDVSGAVSADGTRIEGAATDASGAHIEWAFTR